MNHHVGENSSQRISAWVVQQFYRLRKREMILFERASVKWTILIGTLLMC